MQTLKQHIEGYVRFLYYKNNELWYTTDRTAFLFAVPIEDCGDAKFLNMDKGIFFMRYIRKHMENLANE